MSPGQRSNRSPLLRLYSALLPLWLRETIKARLSPDAHDLLTRGVNHFGPIGLLIGFLRRIMVRTRFARLLRRSDVVLAKSEQGLVLARVLEQATALHVRRLTLKTVTDALTAVGIAHFAVRGFDPIRSVIAVPASARASVLSALAAIARNTPVYVGEGILKESGPLWPAGSAWTWRRLSHARVIRFVVFTVDPGGSLLQGDKSGCDIEFWTEEDGVLRAPRTNRSSDSVRLDEPAVSLGESAFTMLASESSADSPRYVTRPEMVGTLLDDITFPIDVVYTWVDGDDPAWQARRDKAMGVVTDALNAQSANPSRFINRDELRYSFRSLAMFAPWVRHIYLVTDDQVPNWLNADHPQVTVVSHKELFAGRGELPTFNSHAIESQLHHIEGLSEQFVYLNDDVFLGRPITPHLFFHSNGIAKIYPSPAKIDFEPVDVEQDIPATAAGKNNRELIMRDYGRRVTYKMRHVPHALRRSVLFEMEDRYAEQLATTTAHQFRHPGDVSLTSSLYQYYATLSGRATTAEMRYLYADLGAPRTSVRLRQLIERQDQDVFCLNDTDSDPAEVVRQRLLMDKFLSAFYPVRSPWERPTAG